LARQRKVYDAGIFLLNDLKGHFLDRCGVIALEFSEEPSISFYTEEVRTYFESKFARIFRGRRSSRATICGRNRRRQQAASLRRALCSGLDERD
jgi:hypothetical protein